MAPIVFVVFIAVPLIEIALFIQCGDWIGVWPTIALVVLRLRERNGEPLDQAPTPFEINEAIDLSKLFSSPDSKRFINGILDKMKGTIQRPLREAVER